MKNQYLKAGIPVLLFILSSQGYAETEWRSCNVSALPTPNSITNTKPGAVYLEADTGSLQSKGISSLEGNVTIQQDSKYIHADKASYDNRNGNVTAFGNILFKTETLEFKSSEINYQMTRNTGEIKNATYSLREGAGHGSSKLINQQGKEKTNLKQATFSTCPPQNQSWHIASSDIELNHKTQEGKARNVTFKAGSIPIFYTPYFSFPLKNQRKSGFLAPNFKVSDRSGTIIGIPYYLNLAPNFDATVAPNLLTNRGVKFDTEFRYLTKNDEGIITYDFLPNDDVFNNEDRSLISIKHKTRISANTELTIDAADVSDRSYFEDFGDSLVSSSIAALERRVDLRRTGHDWNFNVSVQDYKVLDSTTSDTPYSRLPELRYQYTPIRKIEDTQFFIESELVKFDKDDDVTGLRFDINAIASKRFGTSGYYVEPSVQLRHTEYSLNNNTLSDNDTPSRTLPTASLDAGLFFDRALPDQNKIQTLEPRLFYTYTPYEDQSNIPAFDSAASSFSTSTRLFATNRFTGKDRIGDTNQLTAALTSRFIDTQKGKEILSASIGQIFYFDDRKVTLPDESMETNNRSEIALELAGELNDRTRIVSSTYWDPDTNNVTLTEARLHFSDKKDRRLNLAYRQLDEELEQADFSFYAPLNNSWSVVGKLEYDLQNDRSLETLGGVEYANCCWKTRIVARRFLTSDNVTYDNIPFIEFELKGLGNLGTGAKDLLEEQIYGYDD